MGKKKSGLRMAKNGQNNLLIFFAIIIVLAIISTIIAFYYYEDEGKPTEDQTKTESVVSTAIDGTWVSNYDGKMLTINGSTYAVESPSVEETTKISGQIVVQDNIVTFNQDSGSCKGIEGHYLYSINDEGELFFKLIKDSCESRIERMTMTWFKL